MKVGLLSDSLSSTAGGIFEIERSLALHLRDLGVDVGAWGVDDERWAEDHASWEDIPCHVNRRKGPRIFGFVPGLVGQLAGSSCDLLHLQHLWMYPSVAVHRWHKRTGGPYLVTANGMLEPWTLTRSRWNKRLAAFCYENRMLHSAACLQANTEKEVSDFRAYGLKNPVCVIPNGVALPRVMGHGSRTREVGRRNEVKSIMGQEIGDPGAAGPISDFQDFRFSNFQQNAPRVLLYLGRIHPKKGLVNALRAWSEVTGNSENLKIRNTENWQFVIAGWGQGGHEEELKALCRELGLAYADTPVSEILTKNEEPRAERSETDGAKRSNARSPDTTNHERVAFVGPVFGAEKDALLRRADAFLLPSFSEGLPMAVLEAWAYGLPVLMTDHCNLPEGFREGAALRIGTDAESIAAGIRELFQGSCQNLESMGTRGRRLVEERFTWPKVAAQMKEVYEWMLGGGGKPGCVT